MINIVLIIIGSSAPKKESAEQAPAKEPPKPQKKPSELQRPLKPTQVVNKTGPKPTQDASKTGPDAIPKTTINAKPRVDTWRTPRKKAMADVVVDKVVATKEEEGTKE